MSQTIDVGDLLDRSSWSSYQKLLTLLVAIAVVFDGFDIQILGFAIPSLMDEWKVARADFGFVLAVGLVGMTVGGPLAGYYGDRFGRRTTLIVCVLTFALATIATAFIEGIVGLTVLRLLTGIGAGGALPNVTALTAELAPVRMRSMAVKLTIVCVPLGGMLGGLLAAQILPRYGWRGLYLVGGALPLLFAVVLWAYLPESPRFLVSRRESWPQLARLLTRIGHTIPAGASFASREEAERGERPSLSGLFSSGLARDTVGLWGAFFFSLGFNYLVMGWLPALLVAEGLDLEVAVSGLATFNLGGVLGVLVWSVLVTKLGTRGPVLSGALACAGGALAVSAAPVEAHGHPVALLVCIGVTGLFAGAVQASLYALAAHVYPTAMRATGVAYSAAVGRAGGLLSSLVGASLIQAGGGTFWYTLAIAMVCTFLGLAWVKSHYAVARVDAIRATGI
ncbi:MAG: MFS transporter [Bryobacterales bacterium]